MLLIVRDTVVLALRILRLHDAQGADHGLGETSPDSSRKSAYRLRQYVNSPRREDPYTPGLGDRRSTVTVISELDVVLSSLQKNGNAFKL